MAPAVEISGNCLGYLRRLDPANDTNYRRWRDGKEGRLLYRVRYHGRIGRQEN